MRLRPRSLYARLALGLLGVLGAAGSALLVAAWWYASLAADEAYDQVLLGGALQIAENTWMNKGVLDVDVPLAAFSVLSDRDKVFYQVIGPSRQVAAGDASLNVPVPWDEIKRGAVLRAATVQGLQVRVAIVGRHVVESDPEGWAAIVLAETRLARDALARSLATKALWIIGLMGAITLAAAMLAAQRALKPLREVASAIRGRDAASREPLVLDAPPEAEVLVVTINDFIARLNERIALMRRVLGDVAHQIRTPLAAIASQVELLEHAVDESARQAQAKRIKERLEDVGELSGQMLSHAMVLHRSQVVTLEPFDLADLVRQQLLRELEDQRLAAVDVEFRGGEQPIVIQGDPIMLKEAIRNVLGNAVAYGVRKKLSVSLTEHRGRVTVRVTDDGPGIDIERAQRLLTPFTPRTGGRMGASLGLAIVDEVMRAHDGDIRFERTANGFSVVLSFSGDRERQ